jgi:hypothetical protein
LRAERRHVLTIDWRNARQLLGQRNRSFERLVVDLVRRRRSAFAADPNGYAHADVLARAAGRESICGEA